MGPGYGGWGGMWGFPWMMIFVILIAVFCIFFVLRGRRSGGYWSGDRDDERRETPMEILKRRYAKGEITCEDFGRMKRDIES